MKARTMTMISIILLVTVVGFNSTVMAGNSIYNIVDDYDAVGNGIADDTTAIQNAIDAAYNDKGGIVYVPRGKFKITSTIELKNNVILKGIGVGRPDASDGGITGSVIYVVGDICGINASGDQCGVDGIRILGDRGTLSTKIDYDEITLPTALLFVNSNRFVGGHIAVEDSRGTGLYFYEGKSSSFRHVAAVTNRSHGIYIAGAATPANNTSWFGLLDSRANDGDGVHIKNCFQNAFDQVVVQGNSGDGIEIDSDWHAFLNIYTEANTGEGLVFGSNADYNVIHQMVEGETLVDNSAGKNSIGGFANFANMKQSKISVGRIVLGDTILDSTFGSQLEFSKNANGHYYLTQVGAGDRKFILDGGVNLATTILWLDGRRIKYGSAAPTSGAYVAGEIVFDSTPTPGSYVGWVCTSSGSPGTWKQFGPIEN